VGRALNMKPQNGGVVSVLLESVRLEDALVTARPYEQLGLLLADYEGGWITELFALDAAARLIEEARELADWVIVDSPPLTEVVDALPLARLVDSVLIVTRIGGSRLSAIRRLGELLAENGIKPAGFAVVGVAKPARSGAGCAPTAAC
jgi:Mrp family chromosome partitioning ATPase